MMQPHIAEAAIKRVITEFSSDSHNIFTPFALCNDVLDKIPSLNGDVLVVANLEFVYNIVQRDVDPSRVFFATPCPKKKKMATAWIPEQNIFMYNNMITKEDVGDMKFDVVAGNPPYQTGDEELRKKKKTGTKPLWFFFVEQAMVLAKEDGYVAFVTPTSWMQHYSNVHKHIANKKMVACKGFACSPFGYGVGTTVSYWVIQNAPSDTRHMVIDTDDGTSSRVNFDAIIPAKFENFTIKNEILAKTVNGNHHRFQFTAPMSYHATSHKDRLRENKTSEFRYPVYVTTSKIMWTNIPHELHSQWKVIVPKQGTVSKALVNYDMVTSERGMCYLVDSEQEGVILLSYLNSKLVRFMVESIRHNVNIATAFWRSLPAVDLTRSWTDAELYEHFNLTEEEIKLIEETIK